MAWSAIAMAIGEQLLKTVAAAIVDEFTGNELQEAFDDAIEEIYLNTRRALEESTHKDLQAMLQGVIDLLRQYSVAPTVARLELLTHDCEMFLVNRLKTLDLYDPDGHGLLGHPDFMIAAGLYMAILQERIVTIDEAERHNLVTFLSQSIDHAEDMHTEWQEWNERRFGSVYAVGGPVVGMSGSVYNFYYTFDGNRVCAGTVYISNYGYDPLGYEPPGLSDQAVEEAEQKRQQHMSSEWHKLGNAFMVPSIEVVKKWRSLLSQVNLEIHNSEPHYVEIGPSDALREKIAEIKSQYYKPIPWKD